MTPPRDFGTDDTARAMLAVLMRRHAVPAVVGEISAWLERYHGNPELIAALRASVAPVDAPAVDPRDTEIARLRLALEPGKASKIVAGLFDTAEGLGYSNTSSEPPLSWIIDQMAKRDEKIARLEAGLHQIEVDGCVCGVAPDRIFADGHAPGCPVGKALRWEA